MTMQRAQEQRSTDGRTFSDEDGVVYMVSTEAHALMLWASVFQLRERLNFQHRIAIVATNESSKSLVEKIFCQNGQVQEVFFPMASAGKGKGGIQANKTRLIDCSPFQRSVYLDADTLVMKLRGGADDRNCLEELLSFSTDSPEVMLTQFSDWRTNDAKASAVLNRWRGLEGADLASAMRGNPYPVINTGVFGFSKSSASFFREWNRLTMSKVEFACDEIACQLMFPKYPHRVLSSSLNESVKFPVSDEVAIWHGHGNSFFKIQSGQNILRPVVRDAIDQGFGDFDYLLTLAPFRKRLEQLNVCV